MAVSSCFCLDMSITVGCALSNCRCFCRMKRWLRHQSSSRTFKVSVSADSSWCLLTMTVLCNHMLPARWPVMQMLSSYHMHDSLQLRMAGSNLTGSKRKRRSPSNQTRIWCASYLAEQLQVALIAAARLILQVPACAD